LVFLAIIIFPVLHQKCDILQALLRNEIKI